MLWTSWPLTNISSVLIYRKTLKLSQAALRENSVVNLLSNDVNRFDLISVLLHYMWSAPLMAIIIAYILWQEARWAGMIVLAVVFTIVTIQCEYDAVKRNHQPHLFHFHIFIYLLSACTGKLSSKFRLKTALRTDKRIKFMEEIITGVRVIKMFAWEKPFSKMIDSARKKELNILRQNSYVRCLYMTFALFTTRMAIFCTMLSVCLLYGNENITAAKVNLLAVINANRYTISHLRFVAQIFVISAYFHLMAHTLAQMFVRGVAELAEAYVSVKRLQSFFWNAMKCMKRSKMKRIQPKRMMLPYRWQIWQPIGRLRRIIWNHRWTTTMSKRSA